MDRLLAKLEPRDYVKRRRKTGRRCCFCGGAPWLEGRNPWSKAERSALLPKALA